MDLEGSDCPFTGPRRMGECDDSTVTRQPTLRDVRAALVSLATGDGRYTIVCGRTGTRPVPVSGLRFADRETAASGVRLAETYRAHLRQYDPRLPVHEFVVHETTATGHERRQRVAATAGCHARSRSSHGTPREPVGIRGQGDGR